MSVRVSSSDPRIVECAKAAYEAANRRPFDEHVSAATMAMCMTVAQAAVLKWLAQEPSEDMRVSSQPMYDDLVSAGDIYRSMCAVAAKEISGE